MLYQCLNIEKVVLVADLFNSDRDFSEDVIKQQSMVVAQHNDLITKAKYDLTTNEIKVIDYIISKIKPDDEEFDTVHSSLYEVANVLGLKRSGRTYNQLTNTLRSLRQKEVIIYNEETETATVTGWLQEFDVTRTGQIEAKVSLKLAPYLLALKSKGHYTLHVLSDTIQLDSKYSIRLYKLLREADKHRGKSMPSIKHTPEQLAELMSAPKSYDSWGRLNDKVIKPAIDEINLKIEDMDLELQAKKRGRKVVEVEIYNTFYPIQRDKNNEVPMVNWFKEYKK